MAEELKTIIVPNSSWVQLAAKIPFEINSAGEAALLVISTRDGFGRRIAQTSVPLILLQLGESEIEFPGFRKDPYHLSVPQSRQIDPKGSRAHRRFCPRLSTTTPYRGRTGDGNRGYHESHRGVPAQGAVGQDYVPFSTDIPYEVSSRKAVRLTLRQADERLRDVDVVLESIVIYLEP